jgi:hypothetical protein
MVQFVFDSYIFPWKIFYNTYVSVADLDPGPGIKISYHISQCRGSRYVFGLPESRSIICMDPDPSINKQNK